MLRESFDMTQETFGKHINVSRGHIAFIENGGKVTSVLLKKICKQFKLKEDDFNKNIDEFEYFLTDKEYINKYDEDEMMKLILKLKNEIEEIKSDDTFVTISSLDDWDEYFEGLKKDLEEEKEKLEAQQKEKNRKPSARGRGKGG
mgnify:CR=1 FL=1